MKFLPQIREIKWSNDRPTINGIYFTQYKTIVRCSRIHPNGCESPEVEAIRIIFLMNFNMEIEENLIPEILEMVLEWEKNDSFSNCI